MRADANKRRGLGAHRPDAVRAPRRTASAARAALPPDIDGPRRNIAYTGFLMGPYRLDKPITVLQ